jgi:MFS family permease
MYTIDWARLLSRTSEGTDKRFAGAIATDESPESGSRAVSTVGTAPIVWYLGLTSFFTDVSSEMISSILPIYLVSFLHLSPLAFGTIDGVYQGFAAIARLAGGFIADRLRNHKRIASIGYVLSAVCKLALLAAGNAWSLIALTIATDRAGKGIRTAPRDALISLNSDPRQLATSFGVHRALDAAGAMLGPLVAFMIVWRLPGNFDVLFAASFSVAVIGVGIILFFVEDAKREPGEQAASLAGAVGLLRIPAFRHLCVAGAILSLATASDSFLFLNLQQQTGFAAGYFPLLYVGVASVNSALAVPFGRLADRRGRWRTFVAGHVMLLLVYAALLTPAPSVVRLGLTLLLLGGYYAATDGVLTALAAPTLPENLRGSGLGLLVTTTNAARLLASTLFGALWQWLGLMHATVVFAALLAIALVGATLTHRRQSPVSAATAV